MSKLKKTAFWLTLAAAGYSGALLYFRKYHTRWGATDEEVNGPLPGDEMATAITATHAVTIDAPLDEVWKWLVQIGQDRAGFYSYTIFENLILARIRNSDRIVPEWQELRVGDKVRLASKEVYGDFPLLRVIAMESKHYFVLEGWGAFIVTAVDENKTRLVIRSHRGNKPLGGPIATFLFWEPAHFMMERGMLLGIKKSAEGKLRPTRSQRFRAA